MIDLTPLEVRQKKGDFRRGFRGYDAELVNDFLDLVADRMEELVRENMALKDARDGLEAEVTAYREKERALSDALMTAQKLREDARVHADKEGELLIREARLAADAAREEAARALIREEEALRQARARRVQIIETFRRLLERELSELAVIEETAELGGSPRAPASPSQTPDSAAGKGTEKSTGKATEKAPARARARGSAASERAEDEPKAGAAEKPEDERDREAQADWLSSLVEE